MKNVLVTIKNHPIKVACGVIALAAFIGLFIKKPAKKE
jgi:hypothetical protein